MTVLWQVSLALEVVLLVVFALVVATSLLADKGKGGATVRAHPRMPGHHGRARDRRAA